MKDHAIHIRSVGCYALHEILARGFVADRFLRKRFNPERVRVASPVLMWLN